MDRRDDKDERCLVSVRLYFVPTAFSSMYQHAQLAILLFNQVILHYRLFYNVCPLNRHSQSLCESDVWIRTLLVRAMGTFFLCPRDVQKNTIGNTREAL